MSDLYNRIYALCQSKGVTIGRMCKELGISRGNLTELKMERIKTLKPENLTKISGYFGVTVDYLLGTETEKAPTLVSESGLDEEAKEIAEAYKIADPYVQFGVRKLLGLDIQDEDVRFAARRSDKPRSFTGPDTDVEI